MADPARRLQRRSLLSWSGARCALLALTALVALPSRGAAAKTAPAATFGEDSRVVAVEIPVNVVDRQGQPVRGLSAEDFEVFDEGNRQALSGFEVVDLRQAVAAPAAAASPEPPVVRSAGRRHFLLFFDLSFSDLASVTRARLAAREFVLRELHPEDLAAVAVYSLESGPRMVLTFTPDRAQIAHAIDSLGLTRSAEIDPLRFIISPIQREGSDASSAASLTENDLDPNGLRGAAREQLLVLTEQFNRSERAHKRGQITAFARSLGEMARILATVAGRKQIVLFSEGFDNRLLTGDPLDDVQNGDQRSLQMLSGDLWRVDSQELFGDSSLQTKVRAMLQEFRRADCVIQAVDIGGLRAGGSATDAPVRSEGEETLFYLANETGGELFRNTNDLESQLRQVLERSSVTYLLTFQREDLKPDGKFRRLRVRLKGDRDDLKLSYRLGYYAPRPFSDLHPLEKDLLASDAIATASGRSDLALDVLAAPFRATPEWAYVPVIVEIPGRQLLAGLDGNALPLEIYTYVANDEGEMQDFFTQKVSLDVSRGRQQLTEQGVKYYGHLELTPGRYQLRVLVRNAATGRTGVQALDLEVPSYGEQSPILLPPFFPEPGGRWVMIREREQDRRANSTVYPFTINGEPYVPAARPEVEAGKSASFYLVAYNLDGAPIELDGKLLNAQGALIGDASVTLVERTTTGIAGYDKLLVSLNADELASGDYTLQVGLRQTTRGSTGLHSIPLSVR